MHARHTSWSISVPSWGTLLTSAQTYCGGAEVACQGAESASQKVGHCCLPRRGGARLWGGWHSANTLAEPISCSCWCICTMPASSPPCPLLPGKQQRPTCPKASAVVLAHLVRHFWAEGMDGTIQGRALHMTSHVPCL